MKKTLLAVILTFSVFGISACSSGPAEDPQTVINKAWEKLADSNIEYQVGKIDFSGNTDISFEGSTGSLEGNLDVTFDSRDKEDPKTTMKIDVNGSGEMDGESGSFDLIGEIRTLNKKTFVFLEDFDLDTGSPENNLTANFIKNFFKSQWFFIPESLGLKEAKNFLGTSTISEERMTEIAKKNIFIDLKNDLGKRTYEVKINPDKLKTFIKEVDKETSGDISKTDLDSLDLILSQIDYTLKVKVSRKYDIEWINGNISMIDPKDKEKLTTSFDIKVKGNKSTGNIEVGISGENPLSISMDFTAKHDNKPVTIKEPEDAKAFDPSLLLGFGGSNTAGDASNDNAVSKDDNTTKNSETEIAPEKTP